MFLTQDFEFCFGFRNSSFELGSGYAGLGVELSVPDKGIGIFAETANPTPNTSLQGRGNPIKSRGHWSHNLKGQNNHENISNGTSTISIVRGYAENT